jgi:Trk-type K+ transport system membrane component
MQSTINQDVKKTPVILTIIFTFITGGIYYPCWFLTRRDQINALHSQEKIGKGVFIFGIVIFSISLFLALVSGFLEGMGEELGTAEFLAMAKGVDTVDTLLSLVVGITLLVQYPHHFCVFNRYRDASFHRREA